MTVTNYNNLPDGLEAIIEKYGDIHSARFANDNLVTRKLPYSLGLSWETEARSVHIYAHKLIIDDIIEFFNLIKDFYGLEYMKENGLDVWGGSYNKRFKSGTREWSTHSWGIAFDYLPSLGPRQKPSMMPYQVISTAHSLGIDCGEHFKNQDGMHFQFCKGY